MIRESKADRVFNVFNIVILSLFLFIVLYPLIYVISASFTSASELVKGKLVLFPVKPTLDGYKAVFRNDEIWSGYGNTILYTSLWVIISTTLTILAAYPLSRKDFGPRNVVMLIFSFTMWFSGGMIPNYLLIRDLGLIDTIWALILPGAVGVYNVIIMRTFFQTNIPESLLESAKIDGCSDFYFLIKIVLPLSMAIVAVVMLYTGVSMWNSYMSAFMYLNNRRKYPLQIILREILLLSQVMDMTSESAMEIAANDPQYFQKMRFLSELLKYSLIVLSTIPLMVAYPFLQRYFMKGVMIGAIKG